MDLKKQYIKDGYLLVDVPMQGAMKKLRNRFLEAFNIMAEYNQLPQLKDDADVVKLYKGEHRDLWVAVYDQMRFFPLTMGVCNEPSILEFIKLTGIEFPSQCLAPFIRSDMPFDTSYDFKDHQDYNYNLGSMNSVTVWLPLQDTDSAVGPLEVIPGSHKVGYLPEKDGFLTNVKDSDFVSVPVKCGQALIFSQFLAHRSGKNTSDRIRYSLQIRYNDLKDQEYASRKYYVNKKTVTKSIDVNFKTYFPYR